MLDHDTTIALIKRAQSGDDGAKEELVKENIPLVKSVVKRFKGRGEYDDLMQLGAIGFIKAIQNFDETYGVRFSTYAVPMISGEIKRFLRDDGAVKVSRWAKTLAQKINVFIDEKLKSGEKEPTVDEIAQNFGVEAEQVVFAMDTGHYLLSLSSTVGDDDVTLEDKIVGDRSPDEDLDKIMLKDFIEDLPEREKKVIILRYFRDKTQSEIAAELGVSQVQVSRIECKVLQKLKEKLVEE
ncbi:MAG: SigB/SigF/SigG family RNA polymerase sigma factor [Christensenella sp.]|nr:MAG: SigB/SigF/SigG family RNA polymerase sigma factor [Christensenella sp.]